MERSITGRLPWFLGSAVLLFAIAASLGLGGDWVLQSFFAVLGMLAMFAGFRVGKYPRGTRPEWEHSQDTAGRNWKRNIVYWVITPLILANTLRILITYFVEGDYGSLWDMMWLLVILVICCVIGYVVGRVFRGRGGKIAEAG